MANHNNDNERTEAWELIRDDIMEAIQTGLENPKQIADLKLQVGRLVSHVDSQRRVEEISSKQLHEHHQLIHGIGENPGMKEKINDFSKALASIKKIGWLGISMMTILLFKALIEVIKTSNIAP